MSYLNIISLEEAKNYLRVDIDLTEDDNQITAMIKSSLGFVEKHTNHILFDDINIKYKFGSFLDKYTNSILFYEK